MGWKGTVRSVRAAVRAAERESQRRQREHEKRVKEYEKMQELEQAAFEVEEYENYIEILISVHKGFIDDVDWPSIASNPPPKEPVRETVNEDKARANLKNYKPGLISKAFKRVEKEKANLSLKIEEGKKADKAAYDKALSTYKENQQEWKESADLAKRILDGDDKAKLEAIEALGPFSDIGELGSTIDFSVGSGGPIEATLHVHSQDIVPKQIKSLLKSGKLSVKNMPKGKFFELYQDYVCSCLIRVANETLSLLPVPSVIVTAVDEMLDTKTGHMKEEPILSAFIPKDTLKKLNLESIDPSDSMSNFIHNMKFKKTKGFEPIKRIQAKDIAQK